MTRMERSMDVEKVECIFSSSSSFFFYSAVNLQFNHQKIQRATILLLFFFFRNEES